MNWEKKDPCKSGELCSSQCDHAPFLLGLVRHCQDNPWCLMKSPPRQTGQVHNASHSTKTDRCERVVILGSWCFLPAGLFMGKEQVPLRYFNATPPPTPLTWHAATSRLNLVPTGMTTKNKGNQREQPLSISHPFQSFFPSFPPSLLSPFPLLLQKSTIKNTISNLKHSPCVKLDWKPLLKQITSGEEFFVFTVGVRSQRGQEGLVAMPTAEAASLRETPSVQHSKRERERLNWC